MFVGQPWQSGVPLSRVRFEAMVACFVLAGGTMGRHRVSPGRPDCRHDDYGDDADEQKRGEPFDP
jgi:hypothetical protein